MVGPGGGLGLVEGVGRGMNRVGKGQSWKPKGVLPKHYQSPGWVLRGLGEVVGGPESWQVEG